MSTEHITPVEGPLQVHRRWADVPRRAWGAHNRLAGSVDRGFGVLGDPIEAPLVASRRPRDFKSVTNRCRELVRTGFSSILNSPHLRLSSQNDISSSPSGSLSTSASGKTKQRDT